MNFNTTSMAQYAQFLEDHSRKIVNLCEHLEGCLSMAVQCMDQQSGRQAAVRMAQNIETIKKSAPMADNASKRLILSMRQVESARQVFGG